MFCLSLQAPGHRVNDLFIRTGKKKKIPKWEMTFFFFQTLSTWLLDLWDRLSFKKEGFFSKAFLLKCLTPSVANCQQHFEILNPFHEPLVRSRPWPKMTRANFPSSLLPFPSPVFGCLPSIHCMTSKISHGNTPWLVFHCRLKSTLILLFFPLRCRPSY